jgi:uncharacterized membrane protein YsdA (DUF1294 family)
MRFSLEIALLAAVLTAAIYVPMSLESKSQYWIWLASISITTFLFYGLDKFLARFRTWRIRVPEAVLNAMTLAGGFPGAWVGRFLFRHKTNLREHSGMFAVLVAATLLHGAGIYLYWRFLMR